MENPFLVMRKALGLPQATLATYSKCSEQYIRRLEQGTVSAPSGATILGVYRYAQAHPNGLEKLQEAVASSLKAQAPHRHNGPTLFKTSAELDTLVTIWWDLWLKNTRYQLQSEQLRAAHSVYGICRLLLLHPFVVQRWLKRGADPDRLPADVIHALNDASISQLAFMETIRSLDE